MTDTKFDNRKKIVSCCIRIVCCCTNSITYQSAKHFHWNHFCWMELSEMMIKVNGFNATKKEMREYFDRSPFGEFSRRDMRYVGHFGIEAIYSNTWSIPLLFFDVLFCMVNTWPYCLRLPGKLLLFASHVLAAIILLCPFRWKYCACKIIAIGKETAIFPFQEKKMEIEKWRIKIPQNSK